MKIQHILTAAVIIALTSTSAFADRGMGKKGGTTLKNVSHNNLAVGGDTLIVAVGYRQGYKGTSGEGFLAYNSGGRAIAGSIYLEGDACDCDFKSLVNKTHNNIAIGEATAGSIHVNKAMKKGYGGGPRK